MRDTDCVAFLQWVPSLRCRILAQLHARLYPGGALVLGVRERMPTCDGAFTLWQPRLPIYRRAG